MEEHSNRQRTPFLFTGKELDEETGLYYFGARYYDPRTSVWQSPDPILASYLPARDFDHKNFAELPGQGGVFNPANLNVFAYSHQKPVVYLDPDGNEAMTAAELFWSRMGAAGATSQLDSPAPGPADVAAIVLAIWAIDGLISGETVEPVHTEIPDLGSIAIPTSMADVSTDKIRGRTIMFHYTSDTGLVGILGTQTLLPSTKLSNPNDAHYGSGQYFTDILPGTKRSGQLAYQLAGDGRKGVCSG